MLTKRILFLIIASGSLCLPCFTQQPMPTADAEKAARAQADAYVTAFNKTDAKAVGAFYAEDAQYTTDEGEVVSGRAAVIEGLNRYFARNKGAKLELSIDGARFLTPEILLEKGFATLTSPASDPEVTRYTATYVKKNNAWLIAQLDEITLPPADAASQALGDLAWMVGTWKDNTEGVSVETRVDWTKNNHFLRRSFTITSEGEEPLEGTEVIGYDAAQGRLRSWSFDSEGGFGEGVWTREGNKWLVQFTATAPDGTVSSAQHVITQGDDKRYTWESINRVSGGETLPSLDKVEVGRVANP